MKNKVMKYTGRVLIILFTALLGVVAALLLTINMFCNGPSPSAKNVFITTTLETGALKFLASWFLSSEEIQNAVDQNSMKAMTDEVNTSLIVVKSGKSEDNVADVAAVSKVSAEGAAVGSDETQDIEIHEIAGRTFYATMMIVKDPSRVTMETIYPWRDKGDTLQKLVEDHDAVGGINAGLYNSYNNTGGAPFGVVVSHGQIQKNDPQGDVGYVLIGLNEDDILVVKDLKDMYPKDVEEYVKEYRIRDACCFQEESSDKNNHFVSLIINGNKREMNGAGSGLNPRTVIGQRADGALLLLVTDGRGTNGHLGACASDLISIMDEYGAVNAANLDGGSSACMYYEGDYLMDSVTFYYANSSWYMPFAFIVNK